MMPGETHSKAAGTAADASGCQGCSALQQNLNEYVAALITLKQKIIDTDNLLTEYQKKCDELQFAERENSALRKQVEQMLQKISPLEKCQEELGCLKAELEEKKSSLKIYQDSSHEYTRVKEECLKSDARKKKLEAKVKKLEEAAVKHTEDLKQLKIEKKTLEKELKRTQEKLDEFPKQNNKKVLKHMGTQSSSNEPVETLDKRKIKLLLKELWLCIDSTKERLQNEDVEDVQASIIECSEITEKKSMEYKKEKTAKENIKSRKSVEECGLLPRVQSNHLGPPEMKTCLTSFSVQLEQELLGGSRSAEEDGPITVSVQDCSNDSAFHEDRNPEVFVPSSWEDDSSDSSDQEDLEDKPLMKDLEAIFALFRLPPPLLSPVCTPPPTPLRCQVPSSSPLAPEDYFGDFTDSSEEELVGSEYTMQSLLENGTTESQNTFNSSSGKEESSKLIEQPEPDFGIQDPVTVEMNEETAIGCDILTAELKCKDSKPNSKDVEMPFSGADALSYKEHLVVSCESTEDENKYVSDKDVVPQDNEGALLESKGASFRIPCISTETECLQKISDDLVEMTDNAILNEEICNALLSQEKLVVPIASEEENTLPGTESHQSEFTTQTPISGLASENEKMLIVSEHFQEIARELPGKEAKEMQGLNIQKLSESNQDVPIMIDTSELDIKTDLVSSSPNVMSSNCSNPQFSFDLGCNNEISWKFNGQCTLIEVVSTDFLNETVPSPLHCMEQQSYETMRNKISNALDKQSEPTDYSEGEYNLEKNIYALRPNSATPMLTDQISRETECSDVSKVMTNIYIVDQAAFIKGTGDEQCEIEEAGIELNTTKSDDLISAASQSDLVKRDLDLDLSASCHNIDAGVVTEREYEESPEAKLKCEQEDNKQLQTEMPVLENMLSSSKLDCHIEEVNPREFKVVSISNNQVSIIPEQLKSEEPQVTNLEDFGSHDKEKTLAPENTCTETEQHMPSETKCVDEKKCHSEKIKQIETVSCTSSEDSTTWLTSDLKSFSESLSVENSHYDTVRKLSARSGEIPLQNQKNVSEVDKKQDLQNQSHLKTMSAKEEFPPSPDITLPDGLATEEICSRDASISDVETLITPLDSVSVSVQQVQNERTPENTCLDTYTKEGSAFSSSLSKKDENETHVSLNILNDIVQGYMGSQEETKQDSEDEKDNQISYENKSKNEAETKSETKEQNFNKEPQTQMRETDTHKDAHEHMKKRGSLEIEYLTSALKDFNISAVSETNGFSTSEIVKLLENSQSQDYTSGNSVLECFDKIVANKENKKELKPGKEFEENLRKHSWVKTYEISKETDDSEEEDYPLRKVKCASQFTHCSLGEATKTYTKDVPETQNNCKDAHTKYTDVSSNLNTCNSIVIGHLKEKSLFCEITKCSSDIKQSLVLDFDTERKSCTDTERREHKEYSDAAEVRSDSKDTIEMRPETVGKNTIEQHTSNSEGAVLFHHISRMNSEIVNGYGKDGNLNLSIKEYEDWKITQGENLKSSTDQIVVHELPDAVPIVQSILSGHVLEDALDLVTPTEYTPNTEQEQSDPPSNECHYEDCPSSRQKDGSNSGQNVIFDKDTLWNPSMSDVSFDSQGNNQTSESSNISFDSTHDTLELEPFVDLVNQSKRGSETSNQEPSHILAKTLAKSKVEVSRGKASRKSSRVKSKAKTQQSHLAQPVLATADTSTPTKCSPDTLSKIRQEMGPPLPPLLAPLLATPPRTLHPVSPLMSTSSQSSPTSPLDDLISPLRDTPVPPLMSPLSDDPRYKSPMHSTPSPSDAPASRRILSSPLQFCAATPKHALPVPGRLPPLAVGSTTLAGPQENSVKILDTMYPELSARARTLNILKGNIQLNRCPPADCKNLPGPVNNITGFKTITSTSTAFVKTGSNSNTECDQGKLKDSGTELMSFQSHSGKRPLVPSTILRSAKRLRLDSESPKLEIKVDVPEIIKMPHTSSSQAENEIIRDDQSSVQEPIDNSVTESSSALQEYKEPHDKAMSNVLKKIAESSFDLLPVIRSHVHVGNVSKKPVMRDQEKEVVCEFSTTKKHLAQPLLRAILSELKIHKTSLDHTYIHALCRVYVGICRQLGDLERARLFCYDLLKEDFPESDKLTLFIANIWHDIFAFQGVINKAMQLVVRQRAKGEVLNCLIMYLNWEKTSSLDVSMMISKLLLTIQLCPKMEFHLSEKFGEDLNDDMWEYVFALDLLCCHQKWVWTHDNIISKELWPVMDKWIKHRKGHLNIAYTPDIIVALILRLIGRLGQLGLKEGFSSAVKNISSVICMFIQHSNEEDVPWSIQLAAVYALCDLSPSNPAEVSKVLENWTRMTTKNIPSAVMSCLAEVNLLCAADLS
ncbi:little elongation complex subunit 1 isoform X1 [Vombatus ursinus]|uniref:Little elongation complex subunit 1 C-terminal domain-containing protein n=1 Tax=Vombatus ursinus TaxID=29139 RepID=A0A4X2M3Z5_VOMUR|nr:little elongation complex subunit 1 isoform X1 [Vombatus ursinus]